jgi:hypothetical protein
MTVYSVRPSDNPIFFPKRCPCCGESTDLNYLHLNYSYGKDIKNPNIVRSIHVDVPYCNYCKKHAEKYHSQIKYILGIIPIISAFLFPSIVKTDLGGAGSIVFFGLIIFGVIIFLASWVFNMRDAEKMKKKNCSTANWAIELKAWNTFIIYNKEYAEDFAMMNNTYVTH